MSPTAAAGTDGRAYLADFSHRRSGPSPLCYVVPSAAGARLFRKRGWRGFHAAVAPWAAAEGIDLDSLRVVAALPPAGRHAAPRPTVPLVTSVAHEGSRVIVCTLRVPFELAVFHGHFSTVPIVPGAMLAGWAAALAARHGGWPHGLTYSSQLKFRRIVQPGPEYRLRLEWTEDGSRVDFRLDTDAAVNAIGSVQAPPP